MTQNYTLCEIKENNGRNGKPVWIIVKGIVYDVTKFIKEHPGGEDLILEYAGKDATKAFNDVGHSIDAIHDMKLYKIGVVDNEFNQSDIWSMGANPLEDIWVTSAKKGQCIPERLYHLVRGKRENLEIEKARDK